MTLAARLLLAFGLVAILATAVVGASVRAKSRELIEHDFELRIQAAASGVSEELGWESQALNKRLVRLCGHDTFFDKAHLALERAKGDPKALDPESWIAFRYSVPEQAEADQLDDLALIAGEGTLLGTTTVGRNGAHDARLAALIKQPPGPPSLRPLSTGGQLSMEVHCARSSNGVTVGIVAARRIAPILDRIGRAYRLSLDVLDAKNPVPTSDAHHEVEAIDFSEVTGLKVIASVPRDELDIALTTLDGSILYTGATVIGLALLIAIVLARSLSRPIVALAHETREVVSGEPKHVRGHGGREIARAGGGVQQDDGRAHRDAQTPRRDRAHRRPSRGRAADRARDQEPARPHPRGGGDPAAATPARRPGVRRVLRGGDHHRARRGAPHRQHRDRVHPLQPHARAQAGAHRPGPGRARAW